MSHILWVVVFAIVLLPGAFLALVPMFPAFWYLMAVALLFGALDGFTHLSGANLLILSGIFFLSMVIDWSAGLLGAKLSGAGWKSVLWGIFGGIAGFLLLPPLGLFPGLFLGVFGSELYRHKHASTAFRAAGGALIGTLSGIAINGILALAFVTLFVLFALA